MRSPRFYVLMMSAWFLTGCATSSVCPPSPVTQVGFQDLEAAPAPPGERYYLLVFGAQTTPKVPRYTHSWATAVKVIDRGTRKGQYIEYHTISWFPRSLTIRPWLLQVEPGVNLDLHSSIAHELENGERVSMWGPFEMRPGAYRKFLMQKAFLESGQIGYQCIDTIGEAALSGNGSNCFHALTDMDPQLDHSFYPPREFGEAASAQIVRQAAEGGMLIHCQQTHDWLIPVLRLEGYSLVRR